MFSGIPQINGRLAGLIQFLISGWLIYSQSYVFYYDIYKGSIYIDSSIPFIHVDNLGWHYVFWFIETSFVLAINSAIVLIGILSDILQAPPILRKLFVYAVNMHAYLFVFAVWELLLIIGYLILFRADYAPDS